MPWSSACRPFAHGCVTRLVILDHALSLLVAHCEVVARRYKVLLGRFEVIFVRLLEVLYDAVTLLIASGEVVLRAGQLVLGCFLVPCERSAVGF